MAKSYVCIGLEGAAAIGVVGWANTTQEGEKGEVSTNAIGIDWSTRRRTS